MVVRRAWISRLSWSHSWRRMACAVRMSPRSNTRSSPAGAPVFSEPLPAGGARMQSVSAVAGRPGAGIEWRAPSKAFSKAGGSYRSDVVTAVNLDQGHRLPFVGPEPSYRERQEEHVLSIIPDQFRSAIPQRGARQHCPLPLYRHGQHKAITQSEGRIYHRTVNSVLTVCLSSGDGSRSARGSSR